MIWASYVKVLSNRLTTYLVIFTINVIQIQISSFYMLYLRIIQWFESSFLFSTITRQHSIQICHNYGTVPFFCQTYFLDLIAHIPSSFFIKGFGFLFLSDLPFTIILILIFFFYFFLKASFFLNLSRNACYSSFLLFLSMTFSS